MKKFFIELQRRNAMLSTAGWICFFAAIVCAVLTQFTHTTVLGINAFIKPMKFFSSIWIFTWSMAWYLEYLHKRRATVSYSIMALIVFIYELFVITWQAANGRLSHFNISTSFYALLFSLMGIAIIILWTWTLYITILFFRKKQFDIPIPYLWGIRCGLVIFLIFSMEGAFMALQLTHTIGGPDGGPGLPVVNWSTQYGDFRVAHFFGMHALQIIPILSYYYIKKPGWVVLFATFYFVLVSSLLVQALNRIPLFF